MTCTSQQTLKQNWVNLKNLFYSPKKCITKKIRHDIWSESLVNDVRKIENMDIARLLWIKNIYCLFVCLFDGV
jgi:hypothetical protein